MIDQVDRGETCCRHDYSPRLAKSFVPQRTYEGKDYFFPFDPGSPGQSPNSKKTPPYTATGAQCPHDADEGSETGESILRINPADVCGLANPTECEPTTAAWAKSIDTHMQSILM
jgi:hypothetical protein